MRPALLTAALLVAFGPATALAADPGATPGRDAVGPAATAGDSAAARFARKAATSGQAEIALSRLALSNSEHPRVKVFANRMVSDHGAATSELQRAAEAERITGLPEAPDEEARETREKLAKLHGEAFDRAYVDAMVDDHEEAVELFEDYSEDGSDGALKQFARKMLPALREHLAQAKALEETVARR